MSEAERVLWSFDAHTRAKHAILRGYLEAWMAILSRQASKIGHPSPIRYVDGFAGPGRSSEDELGSPLIALRTAIEHQQQLPNPIRFLFIEKDAARFAHLARQVEDWAPRTKASPHVEKVVLEQGDCEKYLHDLLDRYEHGRRRFGPALVFLDQFGYSAVSMRLLGRILGHTECEVFSFLNWRDLNRFITDETKWPGITSAFGDEGWKEALLLDPPERAALLLEKYRASLIRFAGAKYFCSFAMHDGDNRLLYWLFFCSGHPRGLEEMKRSMWKLDETGQFRFFDRHAGQLHLLTGYDQRWLANHLAEELRGEQLTIDEIRSYVLRDTPCFQYTGALKLLEKSEQILLHHPPSGRKHGSFAKYLSDPDFKVEFK